MTHPDLPAEQAHVDLAYERLAAMRAAAARMLQDAFSERGGTFQAVTERDIRVRNSLSRLEQLEIGRESLVFGRIDRRTADAPATARRGQEAFHIGRLAISDADQEPLVVDWRAPVAEPFYRATGAHPWGSTRRRHFLTEGQRVLDLEDELFDAGGERHGRRASGLSGPQVLLATLERSRTGRMRDIVATVQREQDEIIRGPLPGSWSSRVARAPGKTAVALHRAAYLLYTHRFPLEGQGVLVVGPNPTFLRYIEHVPALARRERGGAVDRQRAVLGGAAGRPGGAKTPPASRATPAWPASMARAVADRERPLRRDGARSPSGARVLRITPAAVGPDRRDRPSAGPGPTTPAGGPSRPCCGGRSSSSSAARWRPDRRPPEMTGEPRTSGRGAGTDPPPAARGRRRPGADVAPADPAAAAARPVRRRAADRPGRRATPQPGRARPAVAAARGRRRRRCRWTDADIALLDEALALLGPAAAGGPPRRRGASPDVRPRGRRRGPGPVADAAADGRPALAVRLDDGRRRHRPGDRHLGAGLVVPGRRAPPGRGGGGGWPS